MKIRLVLVIVLFGSAVNASQEQYDYRVNWKQAFQLTHGDELWQPEKAIIAKLEKTDRDILQAACPALVQDVDSAYIEKILNALTPSNKNNLLLWAAEYNLLFVAKYLLAHNADVNARNRYLFTPLHRAILRRKIEAAQLLLDNHADVNATNDSGYTPLHDAAMYGYVEGIKLLLDSGADKTRVNKYGETAADVAHTPAIAQLINDYKPAGPAEE